MMSIRGLLAALVLFAVSASANAADWYGEFHVGTTRADLSTLAQDERVEGAYGIGVGVKYNEWFSTQIDWHTLGENQDVTVAPPPCLPIPCATVTTWPLPEHAWVLRALPRLPLGESFALELGLGLAKLEGDRTELGFENEHSDTAWMYSFGAEWRFAERWSATVEMQVYEIDYINLDWTGATLRYRF